MTARSSAGRESALREPHGTTTDPDSDPCPQAQSGCISDVAKDHLQSSGLTGWRQIASNCLRIGHGPYTRSAVRVSPGHPNLPTWRPLPGTGRLAVICQQAGM